MNDYLNDEFDHTAEVEETLFPLVQQLHAACTRLDIPFVCYLAKALRRNEDNTGATLDARLAFNIPGPHRTPHKVILVTRMLDDHDFGQKVVEALPFALSIMGVDELEEGAEE